MMTFARAYRHFAILVTALLLLLQGASLSHAASYGPAQHEHDGIICVLSLQNETDGVIPEPQLSVLPRALMDAPNLDFTFEFTSAPTRLYRGRDPPPRAPPHQQS